VSVAVQAIIEGMPEPADLRCVVHDGQTVVTVGSRVLCCYPSGDLGSRNFAVVMLRELGFPGWRVAEVMGLTQVYVSNLRGRARREGSAGLVRVRGRRPKLSAAQVGRARAWRAEGRSDAEIARRLGVSDKTAARVLRGVGVAGGEQAALDLHDATATADTEPGPDTDAEPATAGVEPDEADTDTEAEVGARTDVDARADVGVEPNAAVGVEPDTGPGAVPAPGADLAEVVSKVDADGGARPGWATARVAEGSFASRYAGAMLLHAFTDRVGATDVFASAATAVAGRRFDDLAVLTGVSTVFALGFACLEQAKHPDRAQVGPVVGIDVLPELRTLRPRLAHIADRCDPVQLQRAFAAAMLTAEPCTSGLYFVDEHFMPYAGALPVGQGWNTKRRHAEPGRVDTMIADAAGRAICFTTGEPSGLSTSLPATLDQLRAIVGPDAPIMLGFDRGGAYPAVFGTCRQANAHWITYRRGKLLTPTMLPVQATLRRNGRDVTVVYTDQTVRIKDYGTARQITLFDDGEPVLQILTSDTDSCAGALIWFMRARWRIENLFKYLDFYGIDYLADYTATIETNTREVDNPQRTALRRQLAGLVEQRDQLRARIGALHTDRTITIPALNRESTAAQRKIHTLEKKITAVQAALKTTPAKLPANLVNPDAKRAIHRAGRRALQMVLRLLAANAEHWLAHHLNAYLQDNNEYRTITRNLLHLSGTITYTNTTIHIELDTPNTPRLARALTLLLDEINHTPPHIPGDPRPITYTLKSRST
jgi:Transposase protein